MAARTGRDLRPLFEPRSVAVVGASNDPAKWGQWIARGALRGEHRRSVYLVNRSGGEVLGRPAFRSLDEPRSDVRGRENDLRGCARPRAAAVLQTPAAHGS